MTTISLQSIDKSYGAVQVVRNLNLEIHDQEFLVFLGPSGCGKTTTMRIIAGLEHPTHGTIAFDGKRINEWGPQERDVAMVFQNYGLYPHMTVAQNIGYPLKLRKVPTVEHEARVLQAANRVQLQDLLHRMPRELSGGQRQRVALARSIVRKPQVFLMDEPLSNLDAKLRVIARAQIKHLTQELQVTTIYVTHDQIEAMTLATRVAVMNEGVIRQIGTPEEIYNDPHDTFVASFIGSPAMNIFEVQTNASGMAMMQDQNTGIKAPAQGQWTMGFRCEDVKVCDSQSASLTTEVFTFELLGDCTMATAMFDEKLLTVKAAKDCRMQSGDPLHIKIDPQHVYWFDRQTGKRWRQT